MRNDNKSWKKGPQRVGKQFGGPLARPLGGGVGARSMGGVGARPMGGVGARPMGGGVGGVGMPARPLGFKGGKSAVKNRVYKKGGSAK